MSVSDFDAQYPGFGIPSIPAIDTGVTAVVTTASEVVTLTVPALADGTQPICKRGKLIVSISGADAAMVLANIDVDVDDGTNHECVGSYKGAIAATVGRGGTWILDIFSALLNITKIKNINVTVTTSGTSSYNLRARFLGEHD